MAKVFISYSHVDEKWKELLQSHLGVLAKQDKLEIWEDRQIKLGGDWQTAIEKSLNDCHIAILLISRHFLNSDFIQNAEVPVLLQRRINNGLLVIPVIIAPCPWQAVDWLKAMQGYPKDNQALSGMTDHQIDEKLAALAIKIDQMIRAKQPGGSITHSNALPPEKIQVANLPHTNSQLFGREDELALLDKAWDDNKTNILTLGCRNR